MITVRSGRFGPYVTDGETNASLRTGEDPDAITLERAVELLTARRERVASGEAAAEEEGGRRRAAQEEAARRQTPDAEEAPDEDGSRKTADARARRQTPDG